MKKQILTETTLLITILLFCIFASCNSQSGKKEDDKSEKQLVDEQQIASGEIWLKSIFHCNNGSDFCFPDEEKVCTKRYYEFFIESLEIFEYPNFETEKEQIAAEKVFKNKWKDIYPQDIIILAPFGRGNGLESGQKLKNVSISFLSDTKYTVIVDYGDDIKTTSEVTLVANGNSFLIDYMKSEFIK